MYNGSEVKPIGKTRIQVINPKNNKKYSIEFMVVEENCKSILGVKASQLMNLLVVNKENIFTTESNVKDVPKFITKQHLIEEYPAVFQGQGTLPGTLHLEIDESISPVQLPTRRIPLAVKDKLKAELNRLVDVNVITPVDTPTTWISAIVVTVKKNGDIRLCIDPKPSNKALKRITITLHPPLTISYRIWPMLAVSQSLMPRTGFGMSVLMSPVPMQQLLALRGVGIGGLAYHPHRKSSNVV